MGFKRWQSRGTPSGTVRESLVPPAAPAAMPVAVISPSLPDEAKLMQATPDQVAAAGALGAAKRTEDVLDVRYDNLNKQVTNLRDDLTKLAARVLLLESSTKEPTPPSASPGPAAPQAVTPPVEPTMTQAVVDVGNPGKVVTWESGPNAGKFLRVEKGQSVKAFREEYKLDDAAWDFWKKNQLPLVRQEQAENFTDDSWKDVK